MVCILYNMSSRSGIWSLKKQFFNQNFHNLLILEQLLEETLFNSP